MQKNTQGSRVSTRTLVLAALFTALSIILGKVLKIGIGDSIRISFENLPIILASLSLGPLWGAAVGICADTVGCLIVGFSINPMITACAALMGVLPYVFAKILRFKSPYIKLISASLLSHIICSMILKTIALYIWFGTPFATLIWRVPIYIGTGIIEGYIASVLIDRRVFDKLIKLEK